MGGMLRYKVYRQKLVFMTVKTTLVTLLACAGICLFQLREWAGECGGAAAEAFGLAEQNLAAAEDLVDGYVRRLYYDPMLTQDLIDVFSSGDQQEYLRRRTETSLGSAERIASFPADVQSALFSGERRDMLSAISLYNGEWYNFLTPDSGGGMQLQFHVRDPAQVINPVMGDTLLASRVLYNPVKLSHNLGAIQFWINSVWAFGGAAPDAAGYAAAAGARGGRHVLQEEGRPHADDWLRAALERPESRGRFWGGPFGRVHYTRFTSSRFPYQLVSIVDDRSLVRRNTPALVFLCCAVAFAGALILLLLVFGLRYDARFLGAILQTIEQVRRGDFTGAPAVPPRGAKNEYGMIMQALSGMRGTLGDYIRIEYQLKIKQQEAAMRALQHQINPHFLYNTLEAIRSRALVGGDASTAEAIAVLGGLYRGIVRNQDILTLGEELRLLEQYLKIMELRFPESFCYQLEVEPELMRLMTVKFWMQPLAENFFSHGFDRESAYNLLIVSGATESGCGILRFMDNGRRLAPEDFERLNASMRAGGDAHGKNIGLRNVFMRLSYFYGDGFDMEISGNDEAGVCVSVRIPIPESDDKEARACTPC